MMHQSILIFRVQLSGHYFAGENIAETMVNHRNRGGNHNFITSWFTS